MAAHTADAGNDSVMSDQEHFQTKDSTSNRAATEELKRCRDWLGRLSANVAQTLHEFNELDDFIAAFHRLEQAHMYLATAGIELNRSSLSEGADHSGDGHFVGQEQGHDSVLHFLIADDIILRVLDFLDSQSLVQWSKTCSRFHYLGHRNAQQRSSDMALARQLNNPLQLLRAKEQVQGIGLSRNDKHVPVPSLLLSRRVLVTNCGDPDYNGIYHCTSCNGNGFTFTKPREPLQRAAATTRLLLSDDDLSNTSSSSSSTTSTSLAVRVEQETDSPDGELPLRCILAKRFSNETILWYMSKEVLATEEIGEVQIGDVKQVFCFWSKLMVIGDASPDICQYPSQSSILSRHGEGWQTLSTTRALDPPVVELLD